MLKQIMFLLKGCKILVVSNYKDDYQIGFDLNKAETHLTENGIFILEDHGNFQAHITIKQEDIVNYAKYNNGDFIIEVSKDETD